MYMKKKTVKNIKKLKSSDKMLVVLESLNDNIAIIAEQHLGINNRLDGIEANLDTMKNDISDIKYDLRQKVSYDEFEKMEKRVLKLEKLVAAKF